MISLCWSLWNVLLHYTVFCSIEAKLPATATAFNLPQPIFGKTVLVLGIFMLTVLDTFCLIGFVLHYICFLAIVNNHLISTVVNCLKLTVISCLPLL